MEDQEGRKKTKERYMKNRKPKMTGREIKTGIKKMKKGETKGGNKDRRRE